ncbi:MAG: DNA replication and repair protein RecF, partial [Clostridia bacterium]|nr:DNA replication and repair protein RecF [Clostridia bacterium]
QQRTIALAMKLGEVELYKQETGETPVLLLDDVLSELDKTRRDILLQATEGVQTLLTCTEFDGEVAKLFEVKEGKIVKG